MKTTEKILLMGLMIALSINMVEATNPQTKSVIYIVPTVVDFTIYMPTDTTTITFELASITEGGRNASNQTDTIPIMKIMNTGNAPIYIDLNLTAANPSWAILQCSPAFAGWQAQCACQGGTAVTTATSTTCCNITTTYIRMNSSATAVNNNQTVWCWGNFTSAVAGTTTRTMGINGSTA